MSSVRIERFRENLKQDLMSPLQQLSFHILFMDDYVQAYREMIKEVLTNVLSREQRKKLAEKLSQNSLELIKSTTDTDPFHINKSFVSCLMLEGAHELFSIESSERAKTALLLAAELEISQLQITTTSVQIKDQLVVQDIYQLAEDICNLYQEAFAFGNRAEKAIAAYRLYIINKQEKECTQYLDYIISYLLSCKLSELVSFPEGDPSQTSEVKNSITDRLIELKAPDEIAALFDIKNNALIHWMGSKDGTQLDELEKYAHYVDSNWKEIENQQNKIQKELLNTSLEKFMIEPVADRVSFIKAYCRVINKINRTKSASEKNKLADHLLKNSLKKLTDIKSVMPAHVLDKIFLMIEGSYMLYSNDSVNKAKSATLYAVLLEGFKPELILLKEVGITLYRVYKYIFQYGQDEAKTLAACRLYKISKHDNNSEKYLQQIIHFLSANKKEFNYLLPEINYLYSILLDQGILFSLTQYILKTRSPTEISQLLNKENLLTHQLRRAGSPLNSVRIAFGMQGTNLLDMLEKHTKTQENKV